MERSGMRECRHESSAGDMSAPDYAALHPGYAPPGYAWERALDEQKERGEHACSDRFTRRNAEGSRTPPRLRCASRADHRRFEFIRSRKQTGKRQPGAFRRGLERRKVGLHIGDGAAPHHHDELTNR